MGIKKKLVALALVAVLGIGSAFTVSAADSSTYSGVVPTTDKNTDLHVDKTVITNVVSENSATVTKVASKKKSAAGVNFNQAKDKNGKKVDITAIGNGKKGVFNSTKGRYIKRVTIKSKAKLVTIKKFAFKGSKVNKLTITSKKVQINANAFKGTKQKTLVLNVKKASQLKLKKGAFNGLTKITIKGAKKSQKAKIIKALKAAGFKGTIK